MKALTLFLLCFPALSFASGYRMTGNFTLFGNTFSPLQSTYTLTWTEENNAIQGKFSDNVLAPNAGVTGTVAGGKRNFQIVLPTPEDRHGVKSLVLETTDAQGMSANVTTVVISKDMSGRPLESTVSFSGITPDNSVGAQVPSVENCSTGFGALTGFCGLYSGNTVEAEDSGNLCQLSGTRLELARNGDLNLFFNYNGSLQGIPRHSFGSMLGIPTGQNINSTIRHCGPLAGTNMNTVGCQLLHFVGSFQDFGGNRNFSGTYDIRDEVTGNRCSFSFNLSREAIY
ncbi:MAG: hypothetical protein V4598_17420 [Bdellovibrionota bacterium]